MSTTIRLHYTSDYHVVLPEKYITYEGNAYVLVANDLPTPVLENFEFLGWYLDDQFVTQAVVGTSVVSDTELFAKWKETEVSLITGIGQKRFRIQSILTGENLRVDDPSTGNLYDLQTNSIFTASGLSGKDLLENLNEKVERVATYINVRDHGY